jgi:hypothetical protein
MDKWKQTFAKKMDEFRGQSIASFDRFADKVLEPVFRTISDFVAHWNFQASTPRANAGQRSFRFALTEDCYVLLHFQLGDIDTLEYEYECYLSKRGCITGQRKNMRLNNVNQPWAESCFQTALDDFLEKLSSDEVHQETLVTAEV